MYMYVCIILSSIEFTGSVFYSHDVFLKELEVHSLPTCPVSCGLWAAWSRVY